MTGKKGVGFIGALALVNNILSLNNVEACTTIGVDRFATAHDPVTDPTTFVSHNDDSADDDFRMAYIPGKNKLRYTEEYGDRSEKAYLRPVSSFDNRTYYIV